jgi:mannose-6-phosphate isomerase
MPDGSRSIALEARFIEKPWGRTEIPAVFGPTGGRRIGELWFEHPDVTNDPLLAKYICTSEKLSIQVHPDESYARSKGLRSGKTECWYIVDAEEGATIGLGLTANLSPDEIRSAALDGSIERLIDWKIVAAGDFVHVPAGTIHAIGAGITLLEFQQNADVTYRLYDYGRPRELHLEDGVAVSTPAYDEANFRPAGGPVNDVLVSGSHFTLVRADRSEAIPDAILSRRRWAMPIQGSASAGGVSVQSGGCLLVEAGEPLTIPPSSVVLVGAEGPL